MGRFCTDLVLSSVGLQVSEHLSFSGIPEGSVGARRATRDGVCCELVNKVIDPSAVSKTKGRPNARSM